MTSKNILASVLFASAALVAGNAMANDNPHTQPVNTPSAVSRAEVLADLEIYRESGLAAVEQSETYGYDNARRDAAKAKYAELLHPGSVVRRAAEFGGLGLCGVAAGVFVAVGFRRLDGGQTVLRDPGEEVRRQRPGHRRRGSLIPVPRFLFPVSDTCLQETPERELEQ